MSRSSGEAGKGNGLLARLLGLPSRGDLEKPEGMDERSWGMVHDAHMARYDTALRGFQAGVWTSVLIFLLVVALLALTK